MKHREALRKLKARFPGKIVKAELGLYSGNSKDRSFTLLAAEKKGEEVDVIAVGYSSESWEDAFKWLHHWGDMPSF